MFCVLATTPAGSKVQGFNYVSARSDEEVGRIGKSVKAAGYIMLDEKKDTQ